MCETKAANKNTLKKDFKDYDLITKHIKRGKGGILCGINHGIGARQVIEVTTVNNDNILTVKVVFPKYSIRVIVAYGPQENECTDNKQDFFRDLQIEVEACTVQKDSLLLVGDLNSKIEYVNGQINAISSNGKYLKDVIIQSNLRVLNFSNKCTGKWTHVIRKSNQKSVIDYIIVDEELSGKVTEILIDEDCLHTPFRIVTENKKPRAQYSDHNTIITKFKVNRDNEDKKCDIASYLPLCVYL